jgi:hypothetical protein
MAEIRCLQVLTWAAQIWPADILVNAAQHYKTPPSEHSMKVTRIEALRLLGV